MSGHHLAQINVARLRSPIDAPETAGFVAALDSVNALAAQPDGKILVAGAFTTIGGLARNGLARFNAELRAGCPPIEVPDANAKRSGRFKRAAR